MALPLWSLIDVETLKDELVQEQAAGATNVRLERICRRVTSRIESFTGRRLIARGADIIEYHSLPGDTQFIYPLDYPVTSVVSIHESIFKTYDATTLIPPASYVIEAGDPMGRQRARIVREHDWPWLGGVDVVKLVYRAGFANRAAVPDDLADVALTYAALLWRQIANKEWGIVTRTEVTGATTRWNDRHLTTAHLTDEMQEQLQPYVREGYVESGRRAA